MQTKLYPMIAVVAAIVGLLVGYVFAQSMSSGQLTQAKAQLADVQAQSQSQVAGLQSKVTDAQTQITGLNAKVTDLQSQLKNAKLNFGSKADVFDAKIHDLLQEHAFLLVNTVRRSLDSSASFNASYNALQINIADVASQLATLYGDSKAAEFKNLWQTKIDNFIKYTNTIKAGDNATANSVLASDMAAYVDKSATFWSITTSSKIDKAAMVQLVNDHVANIKASVDYWGARDYPNYFSRLHIAYDQMGLFADAIVLGIVKDKQEKFL